jgi:hypothetical protein
VAHVGAALIQDIPFRFPVRDIVSYSNSRPEPRESPSWTVKRLFVSVDEFEGGFSWLLIPSNVSHLFFVIIISQLILVNGVIERSAKRRLNQLPSHSDNPTM